jgi:hypothetical protein
MIKTCRGIGRGKTQTIGSPLPMNVRSWRGYARCWRFATVVVIEQIATHAVNPAP